MLFLIALACGIETPDSTHGPLSGNAWNGHLPRGTPMVPFAPTNANPCANEPTVTFDGDAMVVGGDPGNYVNLGDGNEPWGVFQGMLNLTLEEGVDDATCAGLCLVVTTPDPEYPMSGQAILSGYDAHTRFARVAADLCAAQGEGIEMYAWTGSNHEDFGFATGTAGCLHFEADFTAEAEKVQFLQREGTETWGIDNLSVTTCQTD